MELFKLLRVGKIITSLLICIGAVSAYGQTVLNNYINEGLKNNLVLQQREISLEKALFTLKEANSLFLPSLNFNASYIHSNGGRYIDFPIGDMLNPVYSTLNKMTNSSSFPQVENVEAYLNPQNFYDVHSRVSVPVINTDLIYNRKIQNTQVELQEFEVEIYKRELIKNIKVAYYNYLMAVASVRIYESAINVVNKNVEINQSLFNNGKGLHASVLRSQSELENIKTQLVNAENSVNNARNYFNFLLNKPLDSAIDIVDSKEDLLRSAEAVSAGFSFEKREELKLLKSGNEIFNSQLRLSRTYWIPKVSAFIDLGSQASNWEVNDKSRYYLLGVQLDMPIFNGFRNSYKVKRSELDLKNSLLKENDYQRQIALSGNIANNALESALTEYQASLKQQVSAQSYFRLIETGYKEGKNSLIEFLDARNQLTSSDLKVNLTTCKVLQSIATVERETASYPLPD